MVGPMLTKPKYWSVRSPSAGYRGAPSRAKLTFAEVPWNRSRSMFSTRSLGSSRGSTSWVKVRRGSRALTTVVAVSSVPSSRATPTAAPFLVMTDATGAFEHDLGAVRLRRAREHLGEAAVAALVERPGAEVPVVLAERVVQQHQPGPLRHRPDLGPDDARGRDVALEDVALEVVVEEVGGAAGDEPHQVVDDLLVDTAEVLHQVRGLRQVLRRLAEDVRRHLVEQRLDDLADPLDVVLVPVHRVGVVRRVAGDLLDVLVAVLPEQQVVAVLHRGERRRHEDRHEPVLDQLELLDDVRPEQAQRVRERGEAGTPAAAPR